MVDILVLRREKKMSKKITVNVLVFLLFSLILTAGVPKILVVYSKDSESAWNSFQGQLIRETLEKANCERQYSYIDSHFKISEDFQPDAVIACDETAEKILTKMLSESAEVPVVFYGIDPNAARRVGDALEKYHLSTDLILNDILGFMREVTSNEYAKNGDWEKIKEDFLEDAERNDKQYTALYIYIKPDGYYYSHVRNYTGVSLKDRAYFPILERGEEVRGYPIIGWTTGRKSAIFGMPIIKNGELTGSIALSVFLEGLNYQLNKQMTSDKNTLLMAVNGEGMLMLNSQEESLLESINDFVVSDPEHFMSVLNENDSGVIVFRQGNTEYLGTYKTNKLTGWKLVYAKRIFDLTNEKETVSYKDTEMEQSLSTVLDEILQRINTLEDSLMTISTQFAEVEKVPDDIQTILESLYSQNQDVYNISYINSHGMVEQQIPEGDNRNEGSGISEHPVVEKIHETKKPVISHLIKGSEDFKAMEIGWPVFNINGDLTGTISLMIRPEPFFGEIVSKSLKKEPYEVWLMQQDGTIIYDRDHEEIGQNIFFDEIYDGYDELKELGQKIIDHKEGKGMYTFFETGGDRLVGKEAIWKTLTIHEREWKIVLTKVK